MEEGLGLVLVGLLGQRELADQDLPRLGQHPLLARGQAALAVPPPQVTDALGDPVHVTGGELLQVGLVAPGRVGRCLTVARAEPFEDPPEPFAASDTPTPATPG